MCPKTNSWWYTHNLLLNREDDDDGEEVEKEERKTLEQIIEKNSINHSANRHINKIYRRRNCTISILFYLQISIFN